MTNVLIYLASNYPDLDQRKEIEKLDQMEKQEKEYQHRLTSLQESSVLANNNLKVEFTNLLNEKGEYIQQLEKEIRELKTKSKMKTQTEPTTFNYKKWGIIGIITLLTISLLVWGYRRIRI